MQGESRSHIYPHPVFRPYISLKEAQDGLQQGILLKGTICMVNTRYNDFWAFIQENRNIIIETASDGNRALDKDVVVLKSKALPRRDNKQPMEVVFISSKICPRLCAGFLKVPHDGRGLLFRARDVKRFPTLKIPMQFCSSWKGPLTFNTLVIAQIDDWPLDGAPTGQVLHILGTAGDFNTEKSALLHESQLGRENSIKSDIDFLDIFQKEACNRQSISGDELMIISIEKSNTNDVDLAISLKNISDDIFEVGVHTSDVIAYLKGNPELQELIKERGSSTHLVDEVYHMLPENLQSACSFFPGQDTLAFSFFFEVSLMGEISKKRFARTVVTASVQLSENDFDLNFAESGSSSKNFRGISDNLTKDRLISTVHSLIQIGQVLLSIRIENGAIETNPISIKFSLNDLTDVPTQLSVKTHSKSKKLFREFIIIMNSSAAEFMLDNSPNLAVLRVREAPSEEKLRQMEINLSRIGVDVDTSSPCAIQASIDNYLGDKDFEEDKKIVIHFFLSSIIRKKSYVCCGKNCSTESLLHYSLGVPSYTHISSPLSKYLDILVQEVIANILDRTPPSMTTSEVTELLSHYTSREAVSRRAGGISNELYFYRFLTIHKRFIHKAVVCAVYQFSFRAFVTELGKFIIVNKEEHWRFQRIKFNEEVDLYRIHILFPSTSTKGKESFIIDILSEVWLEFSVIPNTCRLQASVIRPK